MTARSIPDWPTTTLETPTSIEDHLYAVAAGASLPALLASTGAWLGFDWLAGICAVGIPFGAVLAAVFASGMAGRDWFRAALAAGAIAPTVAGLAIAAWWGVMAIGAAATGWSGGGDAGLASALLGLLFFGTVSIVAALVIGLPITVPLAFATTFVLRWAVSVDRAVARVAMTALVVLAATLGIVSLVRADHRW